MTPDTRTQDGYDMCPSCGHHTSAFCGSCTVMVPEFSKAGDLTGIRYCGCDCYKALHGVSLMDKLFSGPAGTGHRGQSGQPNEGNQ